MTRIELIVNDLIINEIIFKSHLLFRINIYDSGNNTIHLPLFQNIAYGRKNRRLTYTVETYRDYISYYMKKVIHRTICHLLMNERISNTNGDEFKVFYILRKMSSNCV